MLSSPLSTAVGLAMLCTQSQKALNSHSWFYCAVNQCGACILCYLGPFSNPHWVSYFNCWGLVCHLILYINYAPQCGVQCFDFLAHLSHSSCHTRRGFCSFTCSHRHHRERDYLCRESPRISSNIPVRIQRQIPRGEHYPSHHGNRFLPHHLASTLSGRR